MTHGALIVVGLLAAVDNVLVHWLLGRHRLNQHWSSRANLVAESALVALGAGMLTLVVTLLSRQRSSLEGRR